MTTNDAAFLAKLEAVKEIRMKSRNLFDLRSKLITELEKVDSEERALTDFRQEMELLLQEKMAHVEELRQIHADINALEAIMKQSDSAKDGALKSACRLMEEYRPLKHEVDRYRQELLGLRKLPDLHELEPQVSMESLEKLVSMEMSRASAAAAGYDPGCREPPARVGTAGGGAGHHMVGHGAPGGAPPPPQGPGAGQHSHGPFGHGHFLVHPGLFGHHGGGQPPPPPPSSHHHQLAQLQAAAAGAGGGVTAGGSGGGPGSGSVLGMGARPKPDGGLVPPSSAPSASFRQQPPPMKACLSCHQQIHRNAPICPLCKAKSRSRNPKKPKRKDPPGV